jgi:hydroxymethylpyrimidine pyrophosphatase-like HAD family hydrolase
MKRYEELVGMPQVILDSYDEAISKSPAAKMLILTNDPDHLIETAKKELPEGMFHIIRGSPHPFFVEFLHPQVSKGES